MLKLYEKIKIDCHEMIKPRAIDSLYYVSRKIDYHGHQKTNIGGWQGVFDDSVDWFIPFKMEVFAKSKIMMQKYSPKFDLDSLDMYSWANINCFGDSNYPHLHSSSHDTSVVTNLTVLCGVYYITKPKESGDLIIKDQNSDMKRFYSHDFDHTIFAEEGECILFFPDTLHYVGVSRTHEDRISIAFNLIL